MRYFTEPNWVFLYNEKQQFQHVVIYANIMKERQSNYFLQKDCRKTYWGTM